MSALLELVPDGVGDAVRVGDEVGIPDADRGEALFRERGGAVSVGCAACVLAAVELDDQAAGIADEIRDEGADGNLAAELIFGETAVFEEEPELLFGFRGVAAHGFGEAAVAALAQAMGLVGPGDNGGRGCPLTPGPSPTGGEGGDGAGPCFILDNRARGSFCLVVLNFRAKGGFRPLTPGPSPTRGEGGDGGGPCFILDNRARGSFCLVVLNFRTRGGFRPLTLGPSPTGGERGDRGGLCFILDNRAKGSFCLVVLNFHARGGFRPLTPGPSPTGGEGGDGGERFWCGFGEPRIPFSPCGRRCLAQRGG